jgi:hypothetical protein
MVTELQCNEPGCVPIETLVVIMSMDTTNSAPVVSTEQPTTNSKSKPARRAEKVLKPLLEVTAQDISELVDSIYDDSQSEDAEEGEADNTPAAATAGGVRVTTAVAPVLPTPPVMNITRVTMVPNGAVPAASWQAPTSTAATVPATVRASTAAESVAVPPASTASTASTVTVATPRPLPAPGPSSSTHTAPASINPPAGPAEDNFSHNTATDATHSSQDPAPAAPAQPVKVTTTSTIAPRHKKDGTRPRGCPCCDPDNLDNIIDTMMFSHYPMT